MQEALLTVVEDRVRVPDPLQDVDAQRQVLQGHVHREPQVQPLLSEVAVQGVDLDTSRAGSDVKDIPHSDISTKLLPKKWSPITLRGI